MATTPRENPPRPEANTASGHLWTIGQRLAGSLLYRDRRPWNWSTRLEDSTHGTVQLTGLLDEQPGPHLLVAIHGMGGSARSSYCVRLARAAAQHGLSCLRLNMRGSDHSGEDLYNAALTIDLKAALSHRALARFKTISLVGYSLGGHICLRYLSEGSKEPRIIASVSVSPPLDLSPTADHVDSEQFWSVYRRFLLKRCRDLYKPIVARGRGIISLPEAARIQTMREWDERVVAARWGYAGAEDYYSRASVGPRLGRIKVPSLLLVATQDPMIPCSTVRPFVEELPPNIQTCWIERGGHVALPRVDLGLPAPYRLESQMFGWLRPFHEAGL